MFQISSFKNTKLYYKILNISYFFEDLLKNKEKILDSFGINKGYIVLDYGCGTGRHLKYSSKLVGTTGKVYALDINEASIEFVKKLVNRESLKNITSILLKDSLQSINNDSVDIIYALDIFHQVKNPNKFFKDLHRMIKKNGMLYLADGHQPRKITKQKIGQSNLWYIEEEYEDYIKCKPRKI